MRRILFILWWSFLGSSGVVAFSRTMQPATFSAYTLPILLGFAFICIIGATYDAI